MKVGTASFEIILCSGLSYIVQCKSVYCTIDNIVQFMSYIVQYNSYIVQIIILSSSCRILDSILSYIVQYVILSASCRQTFRAVLWGQRQGMRNNHCTQANVTYGEESP